MPTNPQIADFVEQLRASAWLPRENIHPRAMRLHVTAPRGDKAARLGVPIPTPLTAAEVDAAFKDEVRFAFQVDWGQDDESELRRILMVEEEHPAGYTMELLFARDFLTCWGNNADGPAQPKCTCGAELSYEPPSDMSPAIEGTHVRAACDACLRPYDPAGDPPTRVLYDTSYERSAGWRDGRFPQHEASPTEHTFTCLVSHVVVQLDFDKDWPVLPAGQYLQVDPALLALCESVFGEPFEVINLFC